MKFFIPKTTPAQAERLYTEMFESIKDQLRWTITPRRIYSLKYTHDKKACSAEVGTLERQGYRYIIQAIFESNHYVVFTQAPDGGQGIKILINKDEVTSIEDFISTEAIVAA